MSICLYELKDPASATEFRAELFQACEKDENLNLIATPTGNGHGTSNDRFFTLWILEVHPHSENFHVTAQDQATNEWVHITTVEGKVMLKVAR